MNALPPEMLATIFSYTHGWALVCGRVCKTWRKGIQTGKEMGLLHERRLMDEEVRESYHDISCLVDQCTPHCGKKLLDALIAQRGVRCLHRLKLSDCETPCQIVGRFGEPKWIQSQYIGPIDSGDMFCLACKYGHLSFMKTLKPSFAKKDPNRYLGLYGSVEMLQTFCRPIEEHPARDLGVYGFRERTFCRPLNKAVVLKMTACTDRVEIMQWMFAQGWCEDVVETWRQEGKRDSKFLRSLWRVCDEKAVLQCKLMRNAVRFGRMDMLTFLMEEPWYWGALLRFLPTLFDLEGEFWPPHFFTWYEAQYGLHVTPEECTTLIKHLCRNLYVDLPESLMQEAIVHSMLELVGFLLEEGACVSEAHILLALNIGHKDILHRLVNGIECIAGEGVVDRAIETIENVEKRIAAFDPDTDRRVSREESLHILIRILEKGGTLQSKHLLQAVHKNDADLFLFLLDLGAPWPSEDEDMVALFRASIVQENQDIQQRVLAQFPLTQSLLEHLRRTIQPSIQEQEHGVPDWITYRERIQIYEWMLDRWMDLAFSES